MNREDVFLSLQPLCKKIIVHPGKEDIRELSNLIPKLPKACLQGLQVYICFPLVRHLKNDSVRSDVKLLILQCLESVLLETRIMEWYMFIDVYQTVFKLLCVPSQPEKVADVSEELKKASITCIELLVSNISMDFIEDFYDVQNVPMISHGVYICTLLAKDEVFRSLRIAAIRCLMSLSYVHDTADAGDRVLRHKVANVVVHFIPGIVLSLQKIITGDIKQGHEVVVVALQAWSRILMLVMEEELADFSSNNAESEESMEKIHFPITNSKIVDEEEQKYLKQFEPKKRTSLWYKTVDGKLLASTIPICSCHQHSHWKVRIEFVSAGSLLLNNCSRNMPECASQLVETLLILSEDEMEKISRRSKDVLESFSRKCQDQNSKSLVEILEEKFYGLTTKLPRILRSKDEKEQKSGVSLLCGYLSFLGPKVDHLLYSSAHFERLMMSLIQILEFDCSVAMLLESYSANDILGNKEHNWPRPWRQFQHFQDPVILQKIVCICQLLACYGNLSIVCNYLLDICSESSWYKNEATFLLNTILGKGSSSDEDVVHNIKNAVSVYLEPSIWRQPVGGSDTGTQSFNLEEPPLENLRSNVIHTCLLVEGIGEFATCLGENFQPLLIKTLYPLLERAGSSNSLIASAGMLSLQNVAESCGYDSITELIEKNVDYFSYQVTMKLRKVDQNPGVLNVLKVIMKYSKMDVLPYIQEIVTDVLLQSCDTFQKQNATAFVHVFHTFVLCVRRWQDSTGCDNHKTVGKTPEETVQTGPGNIAGKSALIKALLDYRECKLIVDELPDSPAGNESEFNMETGCEEPESISEKKSPTHIQMTVSVMERCVHFLSTKDKWRKILVLETLLIGVKVLSEWENDLLPVVHKIWSPLVNRFQESDYVIVRLSFELLCQLGKSAKDFISSRTLRTVFPTLVEFMKKQCAESRRKDSGSAYRFTQAFKLQKTILDNLGELLINIRIQEKEFDTVITVVLLYLSSEQPPPLQESAVKFFEVAMELDPDAVWLKLSNVWCPTQELKSPYEELKTLRLLGSTAEDCEYKKNVQRILQSPSRT